MNSIKYINNTIFSTSLKNRGKDGSILKKHNKVHPKMGTNIPENKKILKPVDIRPLKEIIPEHYKYISLKRLTSIYKGKDYKYKNLEIECRMNYMSMKKIVKIRLNIKESKSYKEKYYNIYLPCSMAKVTPSLYHKINDIIFLINARLDEFNFKKELGFSLYIDGIFAYLKNYCGNYKKVKYVHLMKAISKFVKSENKKEMKKGRKEIKKHTMSIEDLKEIQKETQETYSQDSLESNSTIEGINGIYGKMNEVNSLISNIHTTLNKYE